MRLRAGAGPHEREAESGRSGYRQDSDVRSAAHKIAADLSSCPRAFFYNAASVVPSETGTPEAPSQVGDSRQVPERSATAAVLQQIILEKCDV
jgi:hypothetical protein